MAPVCGHNFYPRVFICDLTAGVFCLMVFTLVFFHAIGVFALDIFVMEGVL